MLHGRIPLLSVLLVLLSAPVVWLNQPVSGDEEALVVSGEPPVVKLIYSTVEPTSESVTVSLNFDAAITINNNGGYAQKVFAENGEFSFRYHDSSGREYRALATVGNIDKTPPQAVIQALDQNLHELESAHFAVRGDEVVQYRYAVDEEGFSPARLVEEPIVISGLTLGGHAVAVVGLDATGNWQSQAEATQFDWQRVLLSEAEKWQQRPRQTPITEGQKAIEISIGEQHLWAYDGETLVIDSAITSGANGMNTRVGSFAISQMHENKWFDGGFFSDYWMRFDGGIGIHDATWRDSFGGEDYKWRGSHGCVNAPFAVAEWIYGWAEIGTKVVVN